MKNIDLLAYKIYSYDTESFVSDVLKYYKNSIILVFDFEKIACWHKPSDMPQDFKTQYFCSFNSKTLNKWLSPIRFFVNTLLLFSLISWSIIKFRPKICWMENTYAAFISGIFRKLKFTTKTFYLSGDWLVSKRFKGPLTYFGSNMLFPALDYCACRWNDVVLNHSKAISDARREFWRKSITNKEASYEYKFKIKIQADGVTKNRKAICFLGSPRNDSGLDLIIMTLAKYFKNDEFTIKIIGPNRQAYEYFKKLAIDQGVGDKVRFLGFVKTDELPVILSDCFCGLNLVKSNESYTSYTIPGKLVHYLQYLLPVIATSGIGYMADEVKNKNLGVIVKPELNDIYNAVRLVFEKQVEFRSSIINYIDSQPEICIGELIKKA